MLLYAAVIGGVVGFILGALILFLWMRARSRTDAARIAELESRTASFNQAVADKVRAESALEQLKLSSQRELEFARHAAQAESDAAAKAHEAELASVRNQAAAALDAEKRRAASELEAEQSKSAALLDAEKRRAAAELEAEKCKAESELAAMREAQAQMEKVTKERTEHLRQEFKVLSETILKERTENLQTANREQLGAILAPLREQLAVYKKSMDDVRENGVKLNESLKHQYESMVRMTEKIGTDANNLANALKGQNKTQGDWGEMILETILRNSGLVKGVHYRTQDTIRDDSGKTVKSASDHIMRPDVIVNYPDGKAVIIDSKVSLTAYTDYVAADDPKKREDALQRHIRSVQAHVDELVKKDYSAYLRKGDSVDFVVMFIPNDPSYQAALQGDSGLWNRAFEQRILIVNPFNLMTLLYIIKVAWNRMAQERNQQEIVKTAETLLARVQRFFAVFDDVGRQLESTGKKYEAAVKALSGRQGLLGSAEKLKALGVPAKKDQKIPERFTAPEFSSDPLSVRLIGEDEESEPDDAGTDDGPALSDELDLPLSGADDASGDADATDEP
ncbi:MAG: DNA recombination protein RmuC [Lentisphaeria bacterium]|nr:DNA recombination protein RmuC [Lentisphaeria bacterium]